jgi:hypothetical protein
MTGKRIKQPEFFKDVTIRDDWESDYANSVRLRFPELPITFHTIEYDECRWIPKKHKPIIVDATVWAQKRIGKGWALSVTNGVYTDRMFPHCYEGNSCLRPMRMEGDIAAGVWPMNTREDYDKARERLIHLLGGINIDSLLYPPIHWSFDPSLVLPKKLWNGESWNVDTCDYYEDAWHVLIKREGDEDDD